MMHHLVGLFTHPGQEWRLIRADREESIGHFYLTHAFVLAAIPAVCAYIGTTTFGWVATGQPPIVLSQSAALWMAAISYASMLGGVALMAGFTHWMARSYGTHPSRSRCLAFVTYTATPLFVGGLAALYPHLWLGLAIGSAALCYSVYLLFVGLPVVMKLPDDEGFLFASSVLAVGLVVLVTITAFTLVLWGIGMGPASIG